MLDTLVTFLLGFREAGKEISTKNKQKIQAIHDHTAMMLEMACAPGAEDAIVNEAFQARMQEAWRSYSETQQAVQKALPSPYGYIRDIWDDKVVWCAWDDGEEHLYEAPYTIADGVATVGAPSLVRPVTTYEPAPAAIEESAPPLDESAVETEITGDIIPLLEKAVSSDGSARIKVIAPGWGSSGYYSESLLKRDGPAAFPANTKMYWNHPSLTEEADRPERDLRDLAGVTTTDAVWADDPTFGPGLYADTRVFEGFQQSVNDLAPYIGNSIRALGQARAGEAEGRTGPIVEKIVKGESIDFVTTPGAGGKIVSLFEAARPHKVTRQETNDMTEEEAKRLREAYDAMAAENARLREADIVRQVERVVSAQLNASDDLLPMTRDRLYKEAVRNPPIADGKLDEEKLRERTADMIRGELAYLAGVVGGGRIVGMGGSAPKELTEADVESELAGIFSMTGLSESGARIAAQGRA